MYIESLANIAQYSILYDMDTGYLILTYIQSQNTRITE